MIGHEWAVELLAKHIALHHERHAYLITGPNGVGRRTLALRFAQGLTCLNPLAPGQPCRKCANCKRIEAMQHPDLTVVQTEREGETLKIEQIRDLQHNLSLSPYEARYRVALILRFEEAHPSAANAMLKTLEEPPPQVLVILTARNAESLLPTIVSRCEVLRLRTVAIDETSEGLQTVKKIPVELADKLAHLSEGRPGYAIRLFEHPEELEQRETWLKDLFQILGLSRRERFAFSKAYVEDRESLRKELQVWVTLWRDVLIQSSGMTEPITNLGYLSQTKILADALGLAAARIFVKTTQETIDKIDRNINPRLAMDVLLMDFPRLNISV